MAASQHLDRLRIAEIRHNPPFGLERSHARFCPACRDPPFLSGRQTSRARQAAAPPQRPRHCGLCHFINFTYR